MIDDTHRKALNLDIDKESKVIEALNRLGRGDAFLHTNVTIDVFDRSNGLKLKQTIQEHNLITLSGRNLVRDLLGGTQNSEPTHAALGTGATPPTSNDTALVAEVYRDVITRRISGPSQITFQLFVDETDANGNLLQEASLINDNPTVGDQLFARVVFPPINKTASISFTLSWDVIITSS